MIYDVAKEHAIQENLPIRFYFPILNILGALLWLSPGGLFFYLLTWSGQRTGKIVLLIMVFSFAVYFIKLGFPTFIHLMRNVKYWGKREPVLTLNDDGMSYLDVFQLQWSEIEDVKIYRMYTGGRYASTVLQIIILASKVQTLDHKGSFNTRNYLEQLKNLKIKILSEYPNFPAEKIFLLDPRELDSGTKKIAKTIKGLATGKIAMPLRSAK